MSHIQINPIRAFNDNYIWLLNDANANNAMVVDPGDAKPVIKYLQEHGLNLSVILITHHHYDHINGIERLLNDFPQAVIYGPAHESIAGVQIKLSEGDKIDLTDKGFDSLGVKFHVFDVPGHTAGHIAYYASLNAFGNEAPILFCGDTLFAAGCGRLFDGTAEQLYASLSRLAGLPADTQIYCTHEYTLNNLLFAKQVEPDNEDIVKREQEVKKIRDKNLPSLPTTIQQELQTNPFLRVNNQKVINAVEQHAKREFENPAQVFTALRLWKDVF